MAEGKKRVLVIVLVVAVALLTCGVATVTASYIFFPDPLPENIEIPDVVGMNVAEAQDAVPVRTSVNVVESDAEPGTVVAQSRPPGTKTHHDDIVGLDVAGPLVMPKIVGMQVREAQEELGRLGFIGYDFEYDPSSSQPEGSVLTQEPAAGTECWETSATFTIAGMDPYREE